MAKNLELGSIHSCDPVVQKEALVTNIVACMTKETPINKLIEYYSWNGLKRALAWMLKWMELLLQIKQKTKKG